MAHAQLYAQFELIASDQADHLLMVTGREKADLHLISTQELMLCFEGLGENCEFGLVQRHFGVEPLGLLRWAATSPGNLARALEETFSGVGQLEQSNLVKIHGEYMTTDNYYGMGSHTFIKVNEAKEEQIWKDLIKRLQYLRRKLIEDLKSGSKICVYHCEDGASMEEVTELHKALCAYGSRYFLYVRKCDGEHPPGTLEGAESGLMIGYINRLGPDRLPDGDHWNISYDVWLTLCKQAYQIKFRAEHAILST
jgi:hypothetical protein